MRLPNVPRAKLVSVGLIVLAVIALVVELVRADVLPSWKATLDWLGRWWIVGLTLALVVAAVAVWWRGRPHTTPTDKPAADRSARWSQLATVVTAFTALAALVFTALSLRATRDQISVAEQGQITDRYTRAIDQLGTPGPEHLQVRLGGIFALERIAADSPRDRSTVVEVLSAFVRTASPRQATCPKTPADVQAAFVVLARRVLTREEFHDQRSKVDLRDTCLAGVEALRPDLTLFRLDNADLTDAKLRGAHGDLVHLDGATLAGAQLDLADMSGFVFFDNADFSRARLMATKLGVITNAKFIEVDLTKADLTDGRFQNVDFTGAKHDDVKTDRAWYDAATKGAWWVSS